MVLEVTEASLRDMAAAVHAAAKREPASEALRDIQSAILSALPKGGPTIELTDADARVLEDALRRRAWDQRDNSEGDDYARLAERIDSALNPLPQPE